MFCEAYCSDRITKWENVLEKIMNNTSVGLCSPLCVFSEAYCSDRITKWENVLEKIMNNTSVGLYSPYCFAKLIVPTTSRSGKCFGNNYEVYFSWLMQSLLFCEADCSDHITKWENVLETILKDISVGLCSP